MTTVNEAAHAARKMSAQFRAVVLVGDVLKDIGDLEGWRKETAAACEVSRKLAAELKEDADKARTALVEVTAELDDARGMAQKSAKHAEADAKAVAKQADEDAKQVIAEAEVEAKELREQIAVDKEEHTIYMRNCQGERNKARLQIKAIKEELATLKAKYGG